MFDNLTDPLIARFEPGARRLGDTARAYADRIIARLDTIADAVESDETINQYLWKSTGAIAGSGSSGVVWEVPAGDTDYELLTVVIIGPAAATTVRVMAGDGGTVKWAGGASTDLTAGGNGTRFRPGEQVTVQVGAGGGVAGVNLQFRHIRRVTHRPAPTGSAWIPDTDRTDNVEEMEREERHSTPGVFQNPSGNIVGHRHT